MKKGPLTTLRGHSSSGRLLWQVPRTFVELSATSSSPPPTHQFHVQFQFCNYILHAQEFMAYQLRPNGSTPRQTSESRCHPLGAANLRLTSEVERTFPRRNFKVTCRRQRTKQLFSRASSEPKHVVKYQDTEWDKSMAYCRHVILVHTL